MLVDVARVEDCLPLILLIEAMPEEEGDLHASASGGIGDV